MAKRLSVNNFKFGLDGRKSELTSVPGTLVTAENGHINQGAEFEKRKAFVLQGTLPTGCFGLQETTSSLLTFGSGRASTSTVSRFRTGSGGSPANTCTLNFSVSHGIPVGATVVITGVGGTGYNGTVVITSVSNHGNSLSYLATSGTSSEGSSGSPVADTGGTVTFPTGLPTGVTYQRLRHFLWDVFEGFSHADWDGGTTTVDLHALGLTEPTMASVVHSSSYKGNTTVIATFNASSDTVNLAASRQVFYNGACVRAMFYGYSWGDSSSFNQTMNALAMGANVIDRLSDVFTTFLGSAYQNSVRAGIQQDFTGVFASSNPTGLVNANGDTLPTFSITNSANDPVTAVSAVATVYLTAGTSGTISVMTAPDCSSGALSGTVDLIGGAQNFATSLLITAQNIAATINGRTSTTGGYSATAGLVSAGATKVAFITINAPATYGALPVDATNGKLSVTSTGTIKLSNSSITGAGAVGQMGSGGATENRPLFLGGVSAKSAAPQQSLIDFTDDSGSDWIQGSYWGGVLVLNDIEYTVGQGNLNLVTPTFLMPLGRKLYMACGTQLNFSAIDDPQGWESQDTGAGFIQINDFFSSPSNIVALGWYQGKMAVFGRRNSQIWNVNADPAQYTLAQSFQNIGTFAPLSVQSVGDLDILFLSDTGVRSLRVRDSSLNAYVVDVGSPIDSFVQSDIISVGESTAANACAIVEPSSNRYWCYLNGKIYTLSLFPSLKIQAWSTYLPAYAVAGVQTAFTPSKFLVYNGQVYVLASDGKVFLYGGSDNNTYDGAVATIEFPWLDAKEPHKIKLPEKIAVACEGAWQVEFGSDPRGSTATQVVVPYITPEVTTPVETNDSTFDRGSFPLQSVQGTHLKVKAYTSSTYTKVATFSAFTVTYNEGDEQ